jgi:hypothetical protein
MAVYDDYTVEYYNTGTSSWVKIDDLTNLSCSVGRATSSDEWQVSTASFTFRYSTGFDSPVANLQPDAWIRWFAPGRDTTKPTWTGVVKDVVVELGSLWDSTTSTGFQDVLVVSCEGHLAIWGRNLGPPASLFTMPAGFDDVMDEFFDEDSSNLRYGPVDSSLPKTPIRFADRPNAAEWLRASAATADMRILDGVKNDSSWNIGDDGEPSLYIVASYETAIAPVEFSDQTNDATHRVFSNVVLDSLADSYFTRVIVTPVSVAEQISTFGPAPYRDLGISTYSATTVAASDLADYKLALYKTPTLGLAEVTTVTEAQQTKNLDTLGVADLEMGYLPRYQVTLSLRGSTFLAQIEGVRVSASPGSSQWTFLVSPIPVLGWFTLDSTEFGELDDDRLAYL